MQKWILFSCITIVQCSNSSDVASIKTSGGGCQLLDTVENASKVEAQSFGNLIDLILGELVVLFVKHGKEISQLGFIAKHTVVLGTFGNELSIGIKGLQSPYSESNDSSGEMFDLSDSFH